MHLKDATFAFRKLRRNMLLSSISVLGLSIGISACMVMFLVASYELSFERFNPERDRVYRIYTTFSGVFTGTNNGLSTGAATYVKDHFTGLDAVTNFHTFAARVKIQDGQGAKELGHNSTIAIVDPAYFQVFAYYQWVAGDAEGSLAEPFKVVITESKARTYFGGVDLMSVIGKEVHYDDSLVVTVSGVVRDIKSRTDLDFTDFISHSTIEKSWLKDNIQVNSWNSTNSSSQLFVKLASGTHQEKIESQLPALSKIYQEHTTNPDWKTFPKLQPLSELHFGTGIGIFNHSRSVPPKSTLQVLVMVAILLLVIASINFINLETAQASRHAKEVGVRKALGSSRSRLVIRFLWGSFILTTVSVILSVGLVVLSLQYFSEYIPSGVAFDLTDPTIVIFLVSCMVVVTLLAGLYPAVVLSSYQPALALKNLNHANSATSRSAFIRKTLTVFQFSVSQVLIIGTIAMGWQLEYMLNKELGFRTDSIVMVSTPWQEKPEKAGIFKNELAQIPEVTLFTQGSPPIASGMMSTTLAFDNGKELQRNNVQIKYGDTCYIRVYGMELLAGRNLLRKDTADEYLINETYMRELGFDDPREVLGKTFDNKFSIAGVVKDFHTHSLHAPIAPAVILYGMNTTGFGIRLMTAPHQVSDLKPAIDKIETAWKRVYPEHKFDYRFMDEGVERLYETEKRTSKLAGLATGIAILLSCLGLFGLASFTVIQRTKEIGIRKVFGATVNGIMVLLSKDFLKLVLFAFILSAPVAYYLADQWLQGFAYRMDLTVWIFILSGLVSIMIAFITISFRTVAAAKSDPVKSLRYE